MIDILLDENDGDITDKIGDATEQTIERIVFSVKGQWKEYPAMGTNLIAFAKSNQFAGEAEKRVRIELEVDGAEVEEVNFRVKPFEVRARWGSVAADCTEGNSTEVEVLGGKVIEVIALPGQTLLDIAVRYLGAAERAIDLARLNNMSITEDISPGQMIKVDLSKMVNQDLVSYLEEKNATPITF